MADNNMASSIVLNGQEMAIPSLQQLENNPEGTMQYLDMLWKVLKDEVEAGRSDAKTAAVVNTQVPRDAEKVLRHELADIEEAGELYKKLCTVTAPGTPARMFFEFWGSKNAELDYVLYASREWIVDNVKGITSSLQELVDSGQIPAIEREVQDTIDRLHGYAFPQPAPPVDVDFEPELKHIQEKLRKTMLQREAFPEGLEVENEHTLTVVQRRNRVKNLAVLHLLAERTVACVCRTGVDDIGEEVLESGRLLRVDGEGTLHVEIQEDEEAEELALRTEDVMFTAETIKDSGDAKRGKLAFRKKHAVTIWLVSMYDKYWQGECDEAKSQGWVSPFHTCLVNQKECEGVIAKIEVHGWEAVRRQHTTSSNAVNGDKDEFDVLNDLEPGNLIRLMEEWHDSKSNTTYDTSTVFVFNDYEPSRRGVNHYLWAHDADDSDKTMVKLPTEWMEIMTYGPKLYRYLFDG